MRCGFLFIFLASLCFHNVLSLPFAQEQDKSTDSKATESKPGAAKPIDSKPSITKDKSTPASKDAATPKTEAKDTNTKTKPPATQDDQQVQIKLQGAEVPADLIVPATTLVTAGVGGYIYRKEIESLLRGYVLGFNPREAQMDRLKELIPKSHPMYAAIETCVKGLLMDDALADALSNPPPPSKSAFFSLNPFKKQTKLPPPPKKRYTLQTAYDECISTQPECRVTDPYIVHYPQKHIASPCSHTIEAKYSKASGNLSKYKVRMKDGGRVIRTGGGGVVKKNGVVEGRRKTDNVGERKTEAGSTNRVEDVARSVKEKMNNVFMMTQRNQGQDGQEYALGPMVNNLKSQAGTNLKGLMKAGGPPRMGRAPMIL